MSPRWRNDIETRSALRVLCVETTCHRWIPCTKGQWWKAFVPSVLWPWTTFGTNTRLGATMRHLELQTESKDIIKIFNWIETQLNGDSCIGIEYMMSSSHENVTVMRWHFDTKLSHRQLLRVENESFKLPSSGCKMMRMFMIRRLIEWCLITFL